MNAFTGVMHLAVIRAAADLVWQLSKGSWNFIKGELQQLSKTVG